MGNGIATELKEIRAALRKTKRGTFEKQTVTMEQAARRMHVSMSTFRAFVISGHVRTARLGRKRVVSVMELAAFL